MWPVLRIGSMTDEEYQRLTADARVLEQDAYGIKVMETPNASIIKLFRIKRALSGSRLYPYALRFKRNAEKLAERGVESVAVQSVSWQPTIRRHVVVYHKLEGVQLRSLARKDPQMLEQFASFLATLHDRGVYFRSLHFGNVLYRPETRGFALIDVADMKIGPGPLGLIKRIRNLRHVCRYAEDRKLLAGYGWEKFLSSYCEFSNIPPLRRWILLHCPASRAMRAIRHDRRHPSQV